ncbi:MAG: S41 family peptidase [Deltaproteobacteria bacterium]|nr:S41 family peptidase [Deltaproteobacteria bacterium]
MQTDSKVARSVWLVLVALAVVVGCQKQATAPAVAPAPKAQAAAATPLAAEASGTGAAVADSGAPGSVGPQPRANPGKAAAADDDEDGETDERDYWKGVQFDVTNFDEVLDYVDVHYIDAKPDKHRAWVEAANFALLTLEPGEELLPESFHKVRAGNPDEEGRLDGKTEPFVCKGATMPQVLLHHVPEDDYLKAKRPVRKKGRLSDEEVLALREKIKKRSDLYNSSWEAIPFGRPQFECTMEYVALRMKTIQAELKAKRAAAKSKAADAKVADAKPADPKAAEVKAESKAPEARPADAKPAEAKAAQAKATDPKTADAKAGKEKNRPIPDMNRAWEAAAQGYLYALDPHSSVIPRKAWDDSTDKTQDSSFEGIGAVLTQRDDQTIVENPMEGRPAWRAGIRAGDIIHKVDGIDVGGLALNKVVKMIRGPRATKVVLTVSRETEPEPKEYAITRENIEIKNVDGKLLPDYPGVAHVKMTGFIPNSTRDLRAMIEKLSKEAPGGKLTGLVLDLRGNSGGLLTKAIEIADSFLSSGRIVSVRNRDRPEEVTSAQAQATDYGFPVVVLVNDGSASASEIVASALQDNGRALVVGVRTFGKASVQTLYDPPLHYDYYIKLTVARYYAPSGYTLQVVGVSPDVEVAPHVDGKIPVGFREENLNNHLTPVQGRAQSPWAQILPELKGCVDKTGTADAVAKRDPKPQIQPDYQLLKAGDYLRCLAQRNKPTAL